MSRILDEKMLPVKGDSLTEDECFPFDRCCVRISTRIMKHNSYVRLEWGDMNGRLALSRSPPSSVSTLNASLTRTA
jgi:hypothetical protein